MYFKESLLLIWRSDLGNMKECLLTEINANNEWFFTWFYRSPSQSHEELESFCSSLESFVSSINDQHPDIPLPPYYRDVWDYKHTNTKSIQKAISTFDRSKAFLHRNANEKCKILTDILLTVFKILIRHKSQMFGYKTPEKMNRSITISLQKDQNLTRDIMLIQKNIIRICYFIK